MTRIRLLSSATGLALLMSMGCEGTIDGLGAGGAPGSGEQGAPAGSGGSPVGVNSGGTSTDPIGAGTGSGAPVGGNSSGGGSGGAGAGGGTTSGGTCTTAGLPAEVQTMLNNTCIACHGHPPALGVPASLTNAAELAARAASDPTKTYAELALARLQDNAKPMPPVPLSRASAAEISALQGWIAAGMPNGTCADGGAGSGGGGGAGAGPDGGADAGGGGGGSVMGGPVMDPFSVAPTCTSKRTWAGGGGQQMNPGEACVACHARGEGPQFALAGTLYPTAHEPDLCMGVSGASGAEIVIVGADGQSVTLMPNTAGNFSYRGIIAKPYKAKVVYMGRERAMITAQTSGDCNNCHTQNGAMPAGSAAKAPGRILLP